MKDGGRWLLAAPLRLCLRLRLRLRTSHKTWCAPPPLRSVRLGACRASPSITQTKDERGILTDGKVLKAHPSSSLPLTAYYHSQLTKVERHTPHIPLPRTAG